MSSIRSGRIWLDELEAILAPDLLTGLRAREMIGDFARRRHDEGMFDFGAETMDIGAFDCQRAEMRLNSALAGSSETGPIEQSFKQSFVARLYFLDGKSCVTVILSR